MEVRNAHCERRGLTNHGQNGLDELESGCASCTGFDAGACHDRVRLIGVGQPGGGCRASQPPKPAAAAAPAPTARPAVEQGRAAAMAPMPPAPATAARAAVSDPSQAVKVAKVGSTKTIVERQAPVRAASMQQSSSQPTAKAAQAAPAPTAAAQTSGNQLTACRCPEDRGLVRGGSTAGSPSGPESAHRAKERLPCQRVPVGQAGTQSARRRLPRSETTSVRRFASTAEDSVSTFSLDTDRTSFQLALNWARSGSRGGPGLRACRGVDQRVRLRLRASGAP